MLPVAACPLLVFFKMLFIFLLDNEVEMNSIKFINQNTNEQLNDSFYPTSMDASIYFIQQYSKVTLLRILTS